jgi:cob(I)alamin adenosyltransferase
MKIYTKSGDDGSTGLIGGQRVRKSDQRINCFGAVDELNAALGLAAVAAAPALRERIHSVQNDLFVVGSHLAVDEVGPTPGFLPPLDEAMVHRLEMEIDSAEETLPPLRNFILPGGTETAARLHLCRTICRRAERLLVAFAEDRPTPAVIITYLNRLSDWSFVQARWANHQAGVADVLWEKR